MRLLLIIIIFYCYCSLTNAQDVPLTPQLIEQIQKQTNFSDELIKITTNPSFQEATITNKKGDVLRFRFDAQKQTILTFPYQVAFIHYTFEKGWITGVHYLDQQGKSINIPYLSDATNKISTQKFQLLNVEELKQQLEVLSQNDGNATTNDKEKKLVQVLYLNSAGEEIYKTYISSADYWGFQHLLHRL